jgi:hypothetical protein
MVTMPTMPSIPPAKAMGETLSFKVDESHDDGKNEITS